MPNKLPTVTPYLYYVDVDAALKFLTQAFGWIETMRASRPDGAAFHAEMAVGSDGVLLLGCPGADYENPKTTGSSTQSTYVRVSDVDELFARAISAGAKSIERPADQAYGERRCGLEDPEGHCWYLAQSIEK